MGSSFENMFGLLVNLMGLILIGFTLYALFNWVQGA